MRTVISLLAACLSAAAAPQTWLLVDSAEIEAAREKARTQPWARATLDHLVAQAEEAVRRPAAVPDGVGQWPHWYSCKKDGARLVTDSPTDHRCPVCGTVYHGDPYDAVVVGGRHNRLSVQVRALGLAYRFTARAEFARRAGEILGGYADRYRKYPRHNVNGEDKVGGGRIMAQTLDESTWLIPVAFGYALVRGTLDPALRAHIESDLLKAAADAIREHRLGIHNIQCWKNSAVGVVGFATGDGALVREAIDDPERGFRVQIAKGVTEEGLWWEGSLGYHAYTMQALWPLAEAARHAGVDLYDDRYRRLYDAPLALSLPNGDSPGFNDSAGGNITSYGPLYEIAFARWKRPEYGHVLVNASRNSIESLLYGAADPPSGPVVPTESALLPSSGFAVLRSGPTAVAVRYGTHGGGHGHPDKLNIVTFAGGRLFGLDPGSINYGVPLHREWYRSTIAHNTVSVDGQLQANTGGQLEKWEKTALSVEANQAYPGVRLRRSLKLTAGRLADRFECSSDAIHTYDWAFHAPGRLTTSLDLQPRTEPLGAGSGYQHISSLKQARTDGEWWARWENGGAAVTLRFQAAPGTEVFTGAGPGKDPAESIPLIIVRRKGQQTVYDVEHEFQRQSPE